MPVALLLWSIAPQVPLHIRCLDHARDCLLVTGMCKACHLVRWQLMFARKVFSQELPLVALGNWLGVYACLIEKFHKRGCLSNAHKPISSLGASYVSSPYSVHIGCRTSTQTQITWFGPRYVRSLFSAQVRYMPSAKTVINSVGASHTSRPYSSQISC